MTSLAIIPNDITIDKPLTINRPDATLVFKGTVTSEHPITIKARYVIFARNLSCPKLILDGGETYFLGRLLLSEGIDQTGNKARAGIKSDGSTVRVLQSLGFRIVNQTDDGCQLEQINTTLRI